VWFVWLRREQVPADTVSLARVSWNPRPQQQLPQAKLTSVGEIGPKLNAGKERHRAALSTVSA